MKKQLHSNFNMKCALLCFISFFILDSSFILSQGVWSPRTSLPDSARAYGIGFSIGNYGYVGLGYAKRGIIQSYYKDFWQFNPSTNSWTRKANFPGLARICPATFVIGNKAYVVTGQDTVEKCLQECWQYNPSTNTWTQKANFPGAARAYDVGFAIGSKGYVGSGSEYNVDFRKDFWAYDTITNAWTQIADLPPTARFTADGFAANGKGYVCFGADSLYTYNKDIWEYDTSTDSWTQKSSCPKDSLYGASGFVIGNSIYVGTGGNSNMWFKIFWKYNSQLDSWTEQTSFPGPSRSVCSAFSIKDTGYMGFGEDTVLHYFNSIYRFLPDSLTAIENMLSLNNNILISPNPFNQSAIVSFSTNSDNPTVLFFLYDIQGNKISVNIKKSGDNYIIYKEGLQTGIYMLAIKYNNQLYYKKLVIIN